MEPLRSRSLSNVAAPIAAIVLAAGAASLFAVGGAIGILNDAADDAWMATWLIAWALVGWAGIVGVTYAALLVVKAFSRRRVSGQESAFAVAALAVIAVVVATHPLWGSGSGTAG